MTDRRNSLERLAKRARAFPAAARKVTDRARGGAMLTVLLAAGCAINPVSGKRELALVSESQEIDMGRQGAAQVAQTIGLYQDAAVQAYVSRLGLTIAARTERPDLPWEFHVVDDPSVNAFALPGGFIFVTRGLLTHMTNEAELASVLGHESGHVAARHSVQQISRSELAQFGLGLGSVLSSTIRDYSAVAGAGLELMFLKFSRDDETQADQLGFRYALADGYDMREMVSVFEMLQQQSNLSGGGSLPQWQSTHPDPGNRINATEQRLATSQANFATMKVGEAEFLQMIDGMVYGENPRQGFFRGSLFLHPNLKFRFQFPNGWQTQNTNAAVMAISSAQDALHPASGRAGNRGRGVAGVLQSAGPRGRHRLADEYPRLFGEDRRVQRADQRRHDVAGHCDVHRFQRLHLSVAGLHDQWQVRQVRFGVPDERHEFRPPDQRRRPCGTADADRARQGPSRHDARAIQQPVFVGRVAG